MLEYGLIISLVALLCLVGTTVLGNRSASRFCDAAVKQNPDFTSNQAYEWRPEKKCCAYRSVGMGGGWICMSN